MRILALDAGGSNTRAAVVTDRGVVLSRSVSGGGNLTSNREQALGHVLAAVRQVLGRVGGGIDQAVFCLAGESPRSQHEFLARETGLSNASDLFLLGDGLATWFSGTCALDGACLISGTGSIALRIREGRVDAIIDGLGWLVGDDAGGFAVGREVIRAALRDIEGRGPATVLTEAVLRGLPDQQAGRWGPGRDVRVERLLGLAYDGPPMALAKLAPLAFEYVDDAVASRIVDAAEASLLGALQRAWAGPEDGPIVLGGSVLTRGLLPQGRIIPALPSDAAVFVVGDGLAGAAVVGLTRAGVRVGPELHQRLADQLGALL